MVLCDLSCMDGHGLEACDGVPRRAWLLPPWNATVGDDLPACTKCAQILQGCPGGQPGAPMPAPSAAQQRAIRAALHGLGAASAAAA
jgi:4-hydroxy-tetrahydrodipicolinate synthase